MTFPKFEDWTPPWGEDDEEFDAEVAKKLIYGLSSDKDKAKTRLETAKAEKTEVEQELSETKTALSQAEAKGNEDAVKPLQDKVTKLEAELKTANRTILVHKVADEKGIPLNQASRLRGDTEEELEEDADDFVKAFPASKEAPADGDDDEDEGDEEPPAARRQPQSPTNRGKAPVRNESGVVNLDGVQRL